MARIRTIKPDEWVTQNEVWPHGCSLYVITESGSSRTKIGIAEHPLRRLSTLQCGNSRRLVLSAIFTGDRAECRRIERALLSLYIGLNLGGEWLNLPGVAVCQRIEAMIAGGE
jgi:hypothetical protein